MMENEIETYYNKKYELTIKPNNEHYNTLQYI